MSVFLQSSDWQMRISLPSVCARVQGKYQRSLAKWFGRRNALVSGGRPVISFTFDDFPCSAADVAAELLEARKLSGTFYASMGLMGKEAPTGRIFDLERLERIKTRGHELGCHTFDHCRAWDTPPARFETSIIRNAQALAHLLSGAVFKSHAYPIDVPRPATKRRAAKHFACCRGGGQTSNLGRVDLNNLAAFFIEKSRDNLPVVRELVKKNAQQGGWLIFATHDVCDQPTPYGCTPAGFESILTCAVDSGSTVLPVHQALEMMVRPVR